jgi:AcrR family transcriptional regulator
VEAADITDIKAQRKARRASRRRSEILAAALKVFETEGFEAATTKLIAEEADVSEGTIYNYFPDKGDLLIEALKQGSGMIALVENMQRGDATFEQIFADIAKWREAHIPRQDALTELLAQIIARPKLRERYRAAIWEPAVEMVGRAIEARGGLGGLPHHVAARTLLSSTIGLWLMGLADDKVQALIAPGGSLIGLQKTLWRAIDRAEGGER